MSNDQFIGIFVGLLIIMVTVEIGLLSICEHLKEIKRLLKKYAEQKPPKEE